MPLRITLQGLPINISVKDKVYDTIASIMADDHDIDFFIKQLESVGDNPMDDDANRRFADEHALDVAVLLEELKQWRESAEERRSAGGRIIVEGYDEECAKAAFADALNKASTFFDEHHDISVTVLGLQTLPRDGYRATLEINITPLTNTLYEHPDGLDTEMKKEHERSFNHMRKQEEEHLRELVHEHFLVTTGATPPHIPDYFLINFTDAELMNHMIEKEFFKAGHEGPHEQHPQAAVVRIIKPGEDLH